MSKTKGSPGTGPTDVPRKERVLPIGQIPEAAGGPAKDVKRDGIKIRGTGAATKGLMARGPV